MNTETVTSNALRCADAWQRGYERGQVDEQAGCYNDSPLSGEWAGESVTDLLGDLIDAAADEWEFVRDGGDGSAQYCHDLVVYRGRIEDELCDHYEQGYQAAFSGREFCYICSGLCDPKYLIHDNDVTYCGPACSGDLGG